jgi:trigger factor
VKVSAERIEDSQVVLDVELDDEQIERGLDLAYRRLVNRVAIPGFRKGKAPRRMLERFVGRKALLEEALDKLIPDIYSQVLTEQDIDAIAEPQLEILELEPVKFKATVPIRPTIELGDYKSVRVATEPVSISEEQVQKVLEEIRQENTPWEPVERPVAEGDRVTLDLIEREGELTTDSREDLEIVVTPGSAVPVPGFAEQLLGLAKGETEQFTLTVAPAEPTAASDLPDAEQAEGPQDSVEAKADAGASDEAAPPPDAGKPAPPARTLDYEVTLKEIKAQQLPEMDDEWAKGIGEGFDTLEALRERVESNLRTNAESQQRSQVETEAIQKVVEGATVEYPAVLVDHEVTHTLEDREASLRNRRLSLDDFLRLTGRTRDSYRDELREEARQKVVRTLVLGKLAEAEGLTVDTDEIATEFRRIFGRDSGVDPQAMAENEATSESMRQMLLTRKTIRRLVDLATEGRITYPEPSPEEDEENLEPAETDDVDSTFTSEVDDQSIAASEAEASSGTEAGAEMLAPAETDDVERPYTTGADDASISADEAQEAGSEAIRETTR